MKERLQREIEVFVKSKRAPSSIHSQEYLEFLKICEAQNKISLLEADTNLYETISLSQIVLAPPFSGPVVIASELEIPCAYYFLPDTEWLLPKSHHGVEVIREVHDLHNFLLSALSKN